jgi:hypothetical protein
MYATWQSYFLTIRLHERRLQIMLLSVLKQQPLFLSNISAFSVKLFKVRGDGIQ